MIALAQSRAQAGGQDVAGLLYSLAHLDLPTRRELVAAMESLRPIEAVALLVVGIVYLFYGYRLFKLLVIVNAAALGGLVGAWVGLLTPSPVLPPALAVAGAVLLGVLAWPLLRLAVALMGALAGGLAGYAIWSGAAAEAGRTDLLAHAWVGGVLGMLALGVLTFVAFPAAVIAFTSVQGALLAISGACGLLLTQTPGGPALRHELAAGRHLLAVLVAAPALAGIIVQYAALRKKAAPKPPGK